MDEIIKASTELGKQLAYGEVLTLLSAELDKDELTPEVRNFIFRLNAKIGQLVSNN